MWLGTRASVACSPRTHHSQRPHSTARRHCAGLVCRTHTSALRRVPGIPKRWPPSPLPRSCPSPTSLLPPVIVTNHLHPFPLSGLGLACAEGGGPGAARCCDLRIGEH